MLQSLGQLVGRPARELQGDHSLTEVVSGSAEGK